VSTAFDPAAPDVDALVAARPRVASVGIYIVDVLGRPVSALPVGQGSHPLDEIRMTPAGTAGGTAVDLARLGAQVLAVGAIGVDAIGDFLLDSLRREDVDVSGLTRTDAVQTSATILPIHPDGSRPAWHVRGANALFSGEHVPWDRLDGLDALHLGGLTALPAMDGAPAAELLRRAREAGAMTTADCLGVKRPDAIDVLAEALPHVDLFMPNEGEALAIAGVATAAEAARRFRELGAARVIVKRGGDGCLIADDEGLRTLPAHDAPVVDTTGCGDAFCAGTIVARCAGWSIDDAARFGGATAGLTMRALGSDAGARTVGEAVAYMTDSPYRTTPIVPGDPTRGDLASRPVGRA
jgi:sugar/nucleoside kinase (ribokinase family)